MSRLVLVAKRDQSDRRGRQGTAMIGGGSVLGGVGLIASGVPGVREPNGKNIWLMRGTRKKDRKLVSQGHNFAAKDPLARKSPLHPKNIGHNAKTLASLPRAGILGFRGNIHDDFIEGAVRQQKSGRITMKERKSLQQTQQAGSGQKARISPLTRRRMNSTERAMLDSKLKEERSIVRGMRTARRGFYGATIGGGALVAGGIKRKNDANVRKRDGKQADRYSTAAVAAGGTTAGLGVAAHTGLGRFERKYSRQAIKDLDRVKALAPHYGGASSTKAKIDREFGTVIKPARKTHKPEIDNWKVDRDKLYLKTDPQHRAEVGRLRGRAAQHGHFADVFRSTKRGFGYMRPAGAVVAGGGAIGLASTRAARRDAERRQGRQPVRKDWYGPRNSGGRGRVNPLRATEAAVGVTLIATGAPRLKMVNRGINLGRKIHTGNKALVFERAEQVRNAAARGTRQVAPTMRKVPELDGAIDLVPRRLRPVTATLLGAGLVSNARPIRRGGSAPVTGT